MTAFLPPNLLALFAARDPIPYLQPPDKLGHEKKRLGYGGVAHFLKEFEDPKDTPPPTRVETKEERKERKRKERAEQLAYKLEQDLAFWDPHSQNPSTDPYKTLFVARINYDTSESKIRREFEIYGPVRKIKVVSDKATGKPRGYAFIEYEHERDMHSAYKHADGKKIDGRRVLVDVERGRTVKGWRPRRLGGGLGGTRKGGPDENTRFSGRDEYGTRADNYRGDRSTSGAPERPERPEHAERDTTSRDQDRDRRRRSTKSRERERGERRRRSRSREKKREKDGPAVEEEDKGGEKKKRSRRSRSRDKDKENKDTKDKDNKDRKKRSRSRDRDRKRRRSHSNDKRIKEEPVEGQVEGEEYEGDVVDYNETSMKQENYGGSDGYQGYNNGEQDDREEGQYREDYEGQGEDYEGQDGGAV